MDNKQPHQNFKQTVEALAYEKGGTQAFIDFFGNLSDSVREPLVVLDSDLKVLKANHSFYRTFKVKPEGTDGISIYELLATGNGTSPSLENYLKTSFLEIPYLMTLRWSITLRR